jgi:hypothetical protein
MTTYSYKTDCDIMYVLGLMANAMMTLDFVDLLSY